MTRSAKVIMAALVVSIVGCQGQAFADEPKAPWENDDSVVVDHSNAKGGVEHRAITFCEKERGSERMSLKYNSETITVVCRDDPQTSYTFVR